MFNRKNRRNFTRTNVLASIRLAECSLYREKHCECGKEGDFWGVVVHLNPEGSETLSAMPLCKTCLEDLKQISNVYAVVSIE